MIYLFTGASDSALMLTRQCTPYKCLYYYIIIIIGGGCDSLFHMFSVHRGEVIFMYEPSLYTAQTD